MELLTIEDFRAVPHPTAFDVEPFRTIIQRDKAKTKTRAVKELAYIYHMADPKSVYSGYDPQVRPSKLQEDLFRGEKWEQDEIINQAIEKYKELTQSPLSRLLSSSMETVHKLREYFEEIDFNERDENNRLVNNPKDVIMSLGNLGKVVEGLQKLREQVEKEVSTGDRLRGQVEIDKYSE
jgi:phytoene dehydrogenase-like protein